MWDNKWDLLVAGIACNSFCRPGLWGRLKVAERNFPLCVLLYSRFTGFEVSLEMKNGAYRMGAKYRAKAS
jgi:hypothetical protein